MHKIGYSALLMVILVVLLGVYNNVNAQFNAIKADMIRPLVGRYSVAYEYTFQTGIALQLGAELGRYSKGTINGKTDYLLSGISIIPELRYYPFIKNTNSFEGFFIGETFRMSYYKERYEDLLQVEHLRQLCIPM